MSQPCAFELGAPFKLVDLCATQEDAEGTRDAVGRVGKVLGATQVRGGSQLDELSLQAGGVAWCAVGQV